MTYTREQLEIAIVMAQSSIDLASPDSPYQRQVTKKTTQDLINASRDRLADMDSGWQPIDSAPRDTLILMMPKMGLPFVGDIWARDCVRRSDIDTDELVRHMLPNGVIWNCQVDEIESWRPLPEPPTRKD
jgi:hypothetical protein